MEIIADTDRIIAALIKDGISGKIIVSGKFTIYTLEFGIEEVKKYRQLIMKKAHITDEELDRLMSGLISKIAVLKEDSVSKEMFSSAVKVMSAIDHIDVLFIAMSLELGKMPIWTDDTHFKLQKTIRAYSTKELAKML